MKKLFTLLLLGLSFVTFGQVNVSFKVKAINTSGVAVDTTKGVYFVGDVTKWVFEKMEDLGNHVYVFDTSLNPGDTLSFACNLVNSWDSLGNEDWNYWKRYKEPFEPADLTSCTPSYGKWEGDRWMIVPKKDTIIEFSWGVLCATNQTNVVNMNGSLDVAIYPNPTHGTLNIQLPSIKGKPTMEIFDYLGKVILRQRVNTNNVLLDLGNHPAGIYTLRVTNGMEFSTQKFMIK
jgi:hypothetical protein